MGYSIFQINPRRSYGITIGSRIKPDSEFREQVISQIDKAMLSFGGGLGDSSNEMGLT